MPIRPKAQACSERGSVTEFTPSLLLEACCMPTKPAAIIVHPALPQAPCFSSGAALSKVSPPGSLLESFRGFKEKALPGSAIAFPFGTKAQTCATTLLPCSNVGAQPTGCPKKRNPLPLCVPPHFHLCVPPLPCDPLSLHHFHPRMFHPLNFHSRVPPCVQPHVPPPRFAPSVSLPRFPP